MKTIEAIQILSNEQIGDSEQMELAKYMGVIALKRLHPLAPVLRPLPGFAAAEAAAASCPHCDATLTSSWVRQVKPRHCQACGQAIDWGTEL